MPIQAKKLVKTTLYFPEEIHRALRVEAAKRNTTMTEILLEALEQRPYLIRDTPEVKP
jgi:hypothetical protein